MRLIFLGAGPLALPVFEGLLAGPHQVVGLVTQPDKVGKGHHHHENPLKALAEQHGLPILQPEKIRAAEAVAALAELKPDLSVVAAYGQLLSQEVLDLPRLGTINVHASLLPKYRGATPIHAAVLNGDAESGVTIIRLVKKLDAGPMLGEVRTPIGAVETTGQLETRLAALAVPLTLHVIDQLAAGTAVEVVQDEALATHVGKLTKADGQIRWDRPAREVECHLRGMQPWPGPFTFLLSEGKPPLRLKMLSATPLLRSEDQPAGTIIDVSSDGFVVQCQESALQINHVQPDGKRPMATADFLRGRAVNVGDRCAFC